MKTSLRMRSHKWIYVAVVLSAFTCMKPACATTVSTLAGSGRIGIADGRGAQASFAGPAGIALAPGGGVYVADADGQRIRYVSPRGDVRTIAGGGSIGGRGFRVPGAYRDGAALEARFNEPVAIAVGTDHALYIADSRNRCIRRLANGRVTTFAGVQGKNGSSDGPATSATFTLPIGIAVANDGTVYVADDGVGIRRISRDGEVKTVHLPYPFAPHPAGVSTWNSPTRGTGILATYAEGIVELAPAGPDLWPVDSSIKVPHEFRDGDGPIGRPGAIVALAPEEFVESDLRDDTIRYFYRNFSLVLAGAAAHDAAYSAGGYSDGAAVTARFDRPAGVAVTGQGDVFVADRNNRRIRVIHALNRRHAYRIEEDVPQPEVDPSRLRILYLGNSVVFYRTFWQDSIPGTLESGLNADRADLGVKKNIHVIAVRSSGSDLAAYASYIHNVAADLADIVVVQMNRYNVYGELGETNPAADARVVASLQDMDRTLRAHGGRLVIVVNPMEDDLYNESSTDADVRHDIGSRLVAIAQASGAPYINLFPIVIQAIQGTNPIPVFANGDFHMTQQGDAVCAGAILRAMEHLKLWH